MKKIILILLIISLSLINFVSAKDVIYIVSNPDYIKQGFIDSLDELSMSYDIVRANEISNYNFEDYNLILLNNDYFVNWDEIPVNEIPALIANGRNMENWGWTTRITSSSQSIPMHINIDNSHEITNGFDENIQIYTVKGPNIYYLDRRDIYDGLIKVGLNLYDNDDAVIALAEAGTVLTKSGYPDTQVNANSVFFGITDSEYWTEESKELFKNCLLWLQEGDSLESFEIPLREGNNLISFPLILDSNDINELTSENPEIISIKEYNGIIDSASEVSNNKGYFIKSNSDFDLTIQGYNPDSSQNVELNQGMNLVGITSLLDISLSSLPEEVIEVAKRDVNGGYEVSTKYGGTWFNSFNLEPGKGYWFKVNNGVIWNYNP